MAAGLFVVRDRNTIEAVCVVKKIERVILEGFGPRHVVSFELTDLPEGKSVEATSFKGLYPVGQYAIGDRVKITQELLPRLYNRGFGMHRLSGRDS